VTIWKDPVIEMQRTKSQGLLHKQLCKDASMSRQGLPDYLLMFRKWPEDGETSGPEPVHRKEGLNHYCGEDGPQALGIDEMSKKEQARAKRGYSIHVWQRYASPVWFDIRQTDVLNGRVARQDADCKHICPLQHQIIERAVHLWTNKGDTVFTPFAGIGSELYGALKQGRKAIGIELKEAYAEQAYKYLTELESAPKQIKLFGT